VDVGFKPEPITTVAPKEAPPPPQKEAPPQAHEAPPPGQPAPTEAPTTVAATTEAATTVAPTTTIAPTTVAPTTEEPTTLAPTTTTTTTVVCCDAVPTATAAAVTGVSQIAPFECSKHPNPIQVVWEDSAGKNAMNINAFHNAAVKELDVKSGVYNTIYKITKTKGVSNLNACALNPVDHIAYCWVYVGSAAYVARIGEESVEFVAVMPGSKLSAAATISDSGTYYFQDAQLNKIYAIPDIANKKGSASTAGALSVAASGLKGSVPPFFAAPGMLHDIVAVSGGDLDGSGDKVDYLVSLSFKTLSTTGPPKVYVMKMTADGTIDKMWILKTVDEKGSDLPYSAFGAGWNFDNRIFFANNFGKGIYQVPLLDMDLPRHNTMHEAVKVKIFRNLKMVKNSKGGSYDAYATFAIGTGGKFALKPLQTNAHMIVVLTSDPADGHTVANGKALHIFPDSKLTLPGGSQLSTYSRSDTIALQVQGSKIEVLKNKEVIHTWDNDFAGKLVFAKFFIQEDKAGCFLEPDPIVVKVVGASDPTTFNDGMNCQQVPSPWSDSGRCKEGFEESKPVDGKCAGYILSE